MDNTPTDAAADNTGLPPEMQERARKAEKIEVNPAAYKVCEGCDSIVTARVTTCPNCHGYRFDTTREAVVRQARLLATRPRTGVVEEDLWG